ncbi:MAG: class I SAM-dependent methyltransferase [Flavobacteriales bacterium]|nr:class I SAM-dependent methyltransferase [Flavobacteriales bacterium]
MLSPITGKQLKNYMVCKDHLVSKTNFALLIDEETELLVTNPQPDPMEIGKYYESEDYNSHSAEAKSFFDKVYEFVKTINLKNKYSIIVESSKQQTRNNEQATTILDIGCGAGDFLNFCKTKGWSVSGVEPSEKAREISESKLGIKINSDLSLNHFADSSFDVVTMWHVLEHRYDIMETMSELKRIVKPGGLIVIALPNYKSYDAKYYKKFWAAYDVPRHLFHFSRKTIEIIFKKNELELSKIHPMYFDSFYVSLISEKNMTGKMNPLRAIFIGLLSNMKALFSKEASSLIYVSKIN